VRGKGGSLDVLKKWLANLEFQDGHWRGSLQGNPADFLSSLQLMGGKISSITLARPSLESFFMQQIHKSHTITRPTTP